MKYFMDEIFQKAEKREKPDDKMVDQVFLFYGFVYNKKDVEFKVERF